MKTIKQLLELLLKDVISRDFEFGMCDACKAMYYLQTINFEEHNLLHFYIANRSPSWSKQYGQGYWWKKGNRSPRIRWIKKQIKIESNEK